jgi:hypothetical protein
VIWIPAGAGMTNSEEVSDCACRKSDKPALHHTEYGSRNQPVTNAVSASPR